MILSPLLEPNFRFGLGSDSKIFRSFVFLEVTSADAFLFRLFSAISLQYDRIAATMAAGIAGDQERAGIGNVGGYACARLRNRLANEY